MDVTYLSVSGNEQVKLLLIFVPWKENHRQLFFRVTVLYFKSGASSVREKSSSRFKTTHTYVVKLAKRNKERRARKKCLQLNEQKIKMYVLIAMNK